jgi:CRISPR-associated protein Cas5d
MGFGITIRVRGEYALFTRPEMKVERVSYDVITPSAARGIIEAIYWKPAIRWVIDRIRVLNEIQFTNIRRNEVSDKISPDTAERCMKIGNRPFFMVAADQDQRQQRAAMALKNVAYVIEAHFVRTDRWGDRDSDEGHYNIVLRRLRQGQHYHAPCLGTREFPAQVDLVEGSDIPDSLLTGARDLGWMLYDLDFSNPEDIQPKFFRAQLRDGVLDLRGIGLRG